MKEKILEFLGGIVAYGGGLAIIAYLIFQFLGKKTLETWFNKRLKKFEYDLNSLFNRVTIIHEKEFEVLQHAWEKLNDLLDTVRQFIRDANVNRNLDEMTSEELEEFLTKSDLDDCAKQNVRSSENKKNQYFYEKSQKAGNACLDFQDYIDKNAIFLSLDIKSEFKKAEKTIRTAWATRQAAEDMSERLKFIQEACQIIQNKIPPIMGKIEELVQKRLHFYEA